MRTFLTLIFISIINVGFSQENLDGIWIGAYRLSLRDQQKDYSSFRTLIEFNGDRITFKNFENQLFGQNESESTGKFVLNGTYLKTEFDNYQDSLELIYNNSDSLILKQPSENEISVFKKINNPIASKTIQLVNKAFTFSNKLFTDSIDFINDSTFIHLGEIDKFRSNNWSINQYKDFSFLLLDYFETPPFIIRSVNPGEITLDNYYKEKSTATLKEIKTKTNLNNLYGNWYEIKRLKSGEEIPPIPSPPDLENVDKRLFISVKKDTIEIQRFNSNKKLYWFPNTTNNFIIIPEEKRSKQMIWKILDLSKRKLIIERIERYSLSGEVETLILKRKKSR